MTGADGGGTARERAARVRRREGTAVDFDPARLALARRLRGLRRAGLARQLGLTAAAVSQFERGQARPTLPVLAALSLALGVPAEFFRAGRPAPVLSSAGAHFRSLRSTSVAEREQALAFGELVLEVLAAVERHVELPAVRLPDLHVGAELTDDEVVRLARLARQELGVPAGPVPNVVRLLEAHGVAVVGLPLVSRRVDAFSTAQGPRPLVLLNPAKGDKARSRFDAAHELAHLLLHHDAEPGSRLVEGQAHAFAAELLMPAAEIADDLPARPDWVALHALKRRWGVSLKALVVRAHRLGRLRERGYTSALRQLSAWGYPEPGPLGPPEIATLLPRALDLLREHGLPPERIAQDAALPMAQLAEVLDACGGGARPRLELAAEPIH